MLRSGSRAIDTAARYGGDEFALILPESNASEAGKVAARICEQLARDGQEPRVTASVGFSIYPTDGTTVEKLLGAADRALYQMKGHVEKRFGIRNVAACL